MTFDAITSLLRENLFVFDGDWITPSFLLFTFFMTPLVASWLQRRPNLEWLDPIWVCYGFGLLLANTPLPSSVEVAEMTGHIVVPLAIPMLLFRTDVPAWFRQSFKPVVAFVLAVLTVFGSALFMGRIFKEVEGVEAVAAMMTATLTGGTPNLMSVGKVLGVSEDLLVLTNAADLVTGGVYLLFLLTIAQTVLARFLPETRGAIPMELGMENASSWGKRFREGFFSILLSALVSASSAGAVWMLMGEFHLPLVLLGLTTGGIAFSFAPRIRKMHTSFEVGNYLILVFCVAIGSMTDLTKMIEAGGEIVIFAAAMLLMALIPYYILCAALRIDVDTAIIASTAAIMGPALVVPVARRLDNQQAFLTGLTSGLIGYALGNYLGLIIASALS